MMPLPVQRLADMDERAEQGKGGDKGAVAAGVAPVQSRPAQWLGAEEPEKRVMSVTIEDDAGEAIRRAAATSSGAGHCRKV